MDARELDAEITETNLSLAYAQASALFIEIEIMRNVINRIYNTWPQTYEQIEILERTLARMVLRANRIQLGIKQEMPNNNGVKSS